ncbi:DinB family protein [Bacillus sp. RG28]|uniref:DinB family protein n=1 Tax=Gottfriedia endophytica TaxID=2820819 RepID=A0A940NNF8_9BACI|nr:DinB family protein [Gottfriedia endophytica]MBP0725841.1 DinB family protein [Gottfriedia endophytica]
MSELVVELRNLINEVPNKIESLPYVNEKTNPSKWSKIEILGHLCDSGSINHKRFVEILISNEQVTLSGYNQVLWVQVHNYQESYSIKEILNLWRSINERIVKLLSNIKENQWNLSCKLEDQTIVTLEWLVSDYIQHMNHHLKQIFSD